MNQHDLFLREIHKHPDDDSRRLVYAAWLDAHGQPEQAEFIRVQIALSALTEVHPRRVELDVREKALLAEFGEAWTRPLHGLVTAWTFRRGLVDAVTLEALSFLEYAEALFQLAPIRNLALREVDNLLPEVARSPFLARLTGLDLADNLYLSSQAVGALAASDFLTNLLTLDLSNNLLKDEAVTALAASPFLTNLTTLNLSRNNIGHVGIRKLLESTQLARLSMLDLRENYVRDWIALIPGYIEIPIAPDLDKTVAQLKSEVFAGHTERELFEIWTVGSSVGMVSAKPSLRVLGPEEDRQLSKLRTDAFLSRLGFQSVEQGCSSPIGRESIRRVLVRLLHKDLPHSWSAGTPYWKQDHHLCPTIMSLEQAGLLADRILALFPEGSTFWGTDMFDSEWSEQEARERCCGLHCSYGPVFRYHVNGGIVAIGGEHLGVLWIGQHDEYGFPT